MKAGSLQPITVSIVTCLDPNDHGPPIFVEQASDNEIELVANIKVPLFKVSEKSLKRRRSDDGKEWWIIDFVLKVTCMSGETI